MDSLTISPHINSNECYSEKYNISFVHIPKNAGTSITKFLGTNNNFFVHINWSAIKKPQVPTFPDPTTRARLHILIFLFELNSCRPSW